MSLMDTAQDAVGDLNALKRLERFGGSKLRVEITLLFLQEAPSRIASARAALDLGNTDAVRSVAHMLKSSAGQMGALGMQRLCERLENPEPAANLPLLLADLDHELARYIAWLETATLA
jgi:HPt (histidine-containing phosphotransfer) domain-containing protein